MGAWALASGGGAMEWPREDLDLQGGHAHTSVFTASSARPLFTMTHELCCNYVFSGCIGENVLMTARQSEDTEASSCRKQELMSSVELGY